MLFRSLLFSLLTIRIVADLIKWVQSQRQRMKKIIASRSEVCLCWFLWLIVLYEFCYIAAILYVVAEWVWFLNSCSDVINKGGNEAIGNALHMRIWEFVSYERLHNVAICSLDLFHANLFWFGLHNGLCCCWIGCWLVPGAAVLLDD